MPGAIDSDPALPWLVRLRWLFIAGQLVVLPVARGVFGVTLVWWLFAAVLAVAAVSNLVLAMRVRAPAGGRAPAAATAARLMGGVLVFDIALLTLQLGALGGATNPFTVFYLVYITLSAVVLSARWTTAIAGLSIAGYALLFLVPTEAHVHVHGSPLHSSHLQGMWAAFVLAAALVAFFARRITQAIASQREQIATLRETGARNARLASLATLAAGAAHELNSPLSTIAVAAHEAQRRLDAAGAGAGAAAGAAAPVSADLALILEEVDRCQAILHQMAARATHADALEVVAVGALIDRIREQLGADRVRRVTFEVGATGAVAVPTDQVVQSLVALVKNALDASTGDGAVTVVVARGAAGRVAITVEDRGAGIAADMLAKVGEPFFTTKAPGRGLGLGVFLARVAVESCGGALAIESTIGVGTRAQITLPLARGAT